MSAIYMYVCNFCGKKSEIVEDSREHFLISIRCDAAINVTETRMENQPKGPLHICRECLEHVFNDYSVHVDPKSFQVTLVKRGKRP